MKKTMKRMVVGVLVSATEIITPKGQAMEMPFNELKTQSLDMMIISPRCIDEQLRESIVRHVDKFPELFSEKGINRIKVFLEKLKKLCDQGILLRDNTSVCGINNTEDYKKEIFCLKRDYKNLKKIVSPDILTKEVNDCLNEVTIGFGSKTDIYSIEKISKYQKQFLVFKIIEKEILDYIETQLKKIPTIQEKTSVSIYNMIGIQNMLNEFIIKSKNDGDLMKKIELERSDFYLMLKSVHEMTDRNILIQSATSNLSDITEQYKFEAEEKLKKEQEIEREKLEKEKEEEEAATERRKLYAEKNQKNRGRGSSHGKIKDSSLLTVPKDSSFSSNSFDGSQGKKSEDGSQSTISIESSPRIVEKDKRHWFSKGKTL